MEIFEMSTKTRILSIIISVTLGCAFFLIAIYTSTKKKNEYFSHTSEITLKDSFNLKIDNVWFDHGYIFFNDKYYLFDVRVKKTNLDFMEIISLEKPLSLIKKSYSDTLIIQDSKQNYIFILNSKK